MIFFFQQLHFQDQVPHIADEYEFEKYTSSFIHKYRSKYRGIIRSNAMAQ